jgi:SAM-dependent methyltransferase
MSGFSADWLALREAADHRSRNPVLAAALAAHLAGRDTISVVDLGCGTGSNLRALAPSLPAHQAWRLVDHDPALLAAARARIVAWAETWAGICQDGDDLVATRDGQSLRVSFVRADLAGGVADAIGPAPDLVTAAALFDLVSASWIADFAAAVAARRAIFYTVLTYSGVETWTPPHPADAAILAAFHAHQGRDKGFGPSAGPAASEALARAFVKGGYRVRTADSPWCLGAEDSALIRALADGTAAAVREMGRVDASLLADWLAYRRSGAACAIGHTDLLAFPAA